MDARQLPLPDEPEQAYASQTTRVLSVDRVEGALAFSAVGDALGWPQEFGHHRSEHVDFIPWKKTVGGRFWGYVEDIGPGEYSDDTQLTLAIARCIDEMGRFHVDRFAYVELPLWLGYERGGGRAIKAAARSLIRPRQTWENNFYRTTHVDYRSAGANGAAMRLLPIAMVGGEQRAVAAAVLDNALVTHGHPRALVGSLLLGQALNWAVGVNTWGIQEILDVCHGAIEYWPEDTHLWRWERTWDSRGSQGKFSQILKDVQEETHSLLFALPKHLTGPTEEYYGVVGARSPATRGSGIGTVLAGLYLALKHIDDPNAGVAEAANAAGSDTDTIAYFAGALLGAFHGVGAIRRQWIEGLQDRQLFSRLASRLVQIAQGRVLDRLVMTPVNRIEALLRMKAWEIGLHEMFWDALGIGDSINHPALGRGRISRKGKRPIAREGFEARLIRVEFESGQTCTFHSRVARDGHLTDSLTADLKATREPALF
jgi:ADP-ribosylglycohydrolase